MTKVVVVPALIKHSRLVHTGCDNNLLSAMGDSLNELCCYIKGQSFKIHLSIAISFKKKFS